MGSVGTFEAKTKLSALLDRVEAGEEITITRRGRVVAKLVPVGAASDRARGYSNAVNGLASLRKELAQSGKRISNKEIRQWIKEGRRY